MAKKKKETGNIEYQDPENDFKDDALKILKNGKLLDYLMDIFHKDYVGGDEYGRLLIFSSLCGTCNNTSGLHPGVEGESGAGKSFAMKTMTNLLPPEYVVNGTISPKALFYNQIKPGSTIYLDDTGNMSEDLAQVIKIATSKYQEGTSHLSNFNGRGSIGKLSKCLNWWINGVDVGSFDIQILNRNVNVSLGEQNKMAQEDHKNEVFLHQLHDAVTGRPANIVTPEVLTCRSIFRHLLESPQVNVIIPWMFDEHGELIITWNDINNSRNFPIFLDMIRVCASIHRYQRKRDENGSIIAELADYDIALKIWKKVSKEQVSKLNRNDQEILQAMMDLKAYEEAIDIKALAIKIKKAPQTVYERLHGRKLEGIKGLLERDHRIIEEKINETKFDIAIDDDNVYANERESKKGSVGRQRTLLKLTEKVDFLKMSLDVVTLDRDKAQKQLDNILNKL